MENSKIEQIKLPTMAEILIEEFIKPYKISVYQLAKAVKIPAFQIKNILHNKQKISIDIALRFSKYFGTSDNFFINLQNEIELRKSKNKQKLILENIKTFSPITQQISA